MPSCQPNAYCARVARPIAPLAAARPVASLRCRASRFPPMANSAIASSSKHNAVFAFISTAPGTMLRNSGTSIIQPRSALAAAATAINTAIRGTKDVAPRRTTPNALRARAGRSAIVESSYTAMPLRSDR